MTCAWEQLLSIVPHWMRREVDKHKNDLLEEIRLRLGMKPELVFNNCSRYACGLVKREDLEYCINAASQYSPWTASGASCGYITAQGGHRIGICGTAVIHSGKMTGVRDVTSLCIRVSRDFPGIASSLSELKSTIIIGNPGCGKTTLLRDLIREISDVLRENVSVVDEREEIFPKTVNGFCVPTGKHTDVLSGVGKNDGINAVLRTMRPAVIAVDEITEKQDCEALHYAGWCGVKLLATAHAGSLEEFLKREIYRPLYETDLFERVIVMRNDKSWTTERMVM